ncbi:lipoprotein [Nesterenkonia sp. MY13]|uniref:Lipoprotein n=1 Tax=Nesterenkonia sedimenti TaxID=1463632 RepID=A0A7X8TJR6_9MICC|nr:lipoprotein [Nesterenkonia sedimenti]
MKKTINSLLAAGGVVVLSGCGGGSSTNMAEALEELPAVEDRYVVGVVPRTQRGRPRGGSP